ncbi:MAG: type II toxin-antitoxin system Phd/YefM family antitoxin [Desulfobacteraceae bacterium]|nr:type II toxin-antitoxin system Phd/YefM family antitoxin [Desulfobacteraceae bacterium]
MEKVGIRQLKESMGRYMKKIRAGEKIILTDRKKEVAVLVPYGEKASEESLYSLVMRGAASWSGAKPKGPARRIASKTKSVSSAVKEDRR